MHRNWPADKQRAAAQARKLEWLTLTARLSILAVLAFAVASPSIRALWAKNLLALLPPLTFQLAIWLENRPFDPRFPYGLYRANILAHLLNGLLLLLLAGYLLTTAASHIAGGQGPDIGNISVYGAQFWQGWLLLAALAYAASLPIVIGHFREPLAVALHDKALHADSQIGQAEWQSAAAAMVGLLGVHAGLWWADFAATGVIGLQVFRFGWRNSGQAIRDLLDERPRNLTGNRFDPLPERIEQYLLQLDWVASAQVRLREEGRLLTGEAHVCLHAPDTAVSSATIRVTIDAIQKLDWRLFDFALTPCPRRSDTARLRE